MPLQGEGSWYSLTQLKRLFRREERAWEATFAAVLLAVRRSLRLGFVADLIRQNRIIDAFPPIAAAGRLLGNQFGSTFGAGAADAAVFLSRNLTVDVSFNAGDARAADEISRNRLRLIREFTDGQRAAVSAALEEGSRRGLNVRGKARLFRDAIGLTERQQRAVANFRRLLSEGQRPSREALDRALRDGRFDRSVERAIREGRPLAAAQVDRMVERYRERMLRHRSEVIARTETTRAVHLGQEAMYAQAIEAGELRPDQISRTWISRLDGNVRDSHVSLHGLERRLGETWPGFSGPLRFPGDPNAPASETANCRCVLRTRVGPHNT